MNRRPLQVPLVTAGRILGVTSPTTAYRVVPELLTCITVGKKVFVPAQALANKLEVSLEVLWQSIEALEPLAKTPAGPTRREILDQQVARQDKSWAIADALEAAAKKAAA